MVNDTFENALRQRIRSRWNVLHQGNEALANYRRQHQKQTDALVSLLGQIVSGRQASTCTEQQPKTIESLIGHDAEAIREQCEAYMGYAGNNYVPFFPPLFRNSRKLCLDVIELLHPTAISVDTARLRSMVRMSHNAQDTVPSRHV
jgi:hypothetical protein